MAAAKEAASPSSEPDEGDMREILSQRTWRTAADSSTSPEESQFFHPGDFRKQVFLAKASRPRIRTEKLRPDKSLDYVGNHERRDFSPRAAALVLCRLWNFIILFLEDSP
jgi:hypothetical protein